MCGRFVISYTYNDLLKFMSSTFDIFDLDPSIEVPRYNVAPGTKVLSIISDGESYRAGNLEWGFIPSFARDEKSGYKLINARIEGIESKASFKKSFKDKRCLVLADGYYEWKNEGKKKQPYLIKRYDEKMVFFAGLYSKWINDNGESIYSTAIITREAVGAIAELHHRTPVILDEVNAKKWLDVSLKDEVRLLNILYTSTNIDLSTMKVSGYVNNVKNDSSECIKEFTEDTLF